MKLKNKRKIIFKVGQTKMQPRNWRF